MALKHKNDKKDQAPENKQQKERAAAEPSAEKGEAGGEKNLSLRDKGRVALWMFRKIHAVNPHCLPLKLIEGILRVAVVFFPIIGIRYILEAAGRGLYREIFLNAAIVFGGSALLKILNEELRYKNQLIGRKISRTMVAELRLHAMEIDYHTAVSPGQKEAFRLALQNMNYEMGDFRVFLDRAIGSLSDLLSIAASLGMSGVLIFSKPQTLPEGRLIAFMVQPLPSLIAAALLFALGLWLQRTIYRKYMKDYRRFLKQHAAVESVFSYYILEVCGAADKYGIYQNYNMLPMLSKTVKRRIKEIFHIFVSQAGAGIKAQVLGSGVFSVIIFLTAYALAGAKALAAAIPLSALITYAQAFIQLNSSAASLNERVMHLNNSFRYFNDIKIFAELGNLLDTGSLPVEKRRDHQLTLELEHVSFRYPGTDKDVLKDISLSLDMNRRHALVGPNGAGKSSLIYLLTRLYHPTEGRILLNGIDIRKYDYEEYLSLFSVVFQDFRLFALPLGENVAARQDYDEAKVLNSLARAGFLSEKERTPESLLEPVIDMKSGEAHFSGGEQQKIAIARALYKDGSFVILDEPTAALDPKSEAEIYEQLQNLIEDKTTIFISHRMSSCRLCEDIIVLDEGEIAERGTHESLLARRGLYASMWEAQAGYYR